MGSFSRGEILQIDQFHALVLLFQNLKYGFCSLWLAKVCFQYGLDL